MKSTKMFYNINIKSALLTSIKMNLPALLIGETGTGKTSFIYDLARTATKNDVIRINLTGQTGVDELIGKYLASEKGTYWVDGLLITAMKKGRWIVLDEINMALPEILSKLHSLLDDDRKIILNEKEGEIIEPHKDFRFFATMNPNEEYAGTKELNKAFLSRFPIIVNVNYSPKEAEIIQHRTGIDFNLAAQLVRVAREIRGNKQEEKLSYICSTRDLIYCASLIKSGLKKDLAMELAILNKAPIEERVPIHKLISLITGDEIKISEEKSYKSIEEMVKDAQKQQKEITNSSTEITYLMKEIIDIKKSYSNASEEHRKIKKELENKIQQREIEIITLKTGKQIGIFQENDKVKIIKKSIQSHDFINTHMYNEKHGYHYGYISRIIGNPYSNSNNSSNCIVVKRTKEETNGSYFAITDLVLLEKAK